MNETMWKCKERQIQKANNKNTCDNSNTHNSYRADNNCSYKGKEIMKKIEVLLLGKK